MRHIDTADFYGPHVSNELIHEALFPYPDDLVIVTKVGSSRDDKANWIPKREPAQLQEQVHDNLRTLGVDVLDVVNVRMGGQSGPSGGSIARQVEAVAELQEQGLIRSVGVSTVDAQQIAEARTITPIATVQNFYNLANRGDDDLIDQLADDGIAYVPYFPLGGFSPLQSGRARPGRRAAGRFADARRAGVAAAALAEPAADPRAPRRSTHLRENLSVADLELPADAIEELDTIAG